MQKSYYFITRLLLGIAAFFIAAVITLPANRISDNPTTLFGAALLIAVFLWFITQLYTAYRPMIARLNQIYPARKEGLRYAFFFILLGLGILFPEQKALAQANCSCGDFIYLNDVDGSTAGRVHKFQVNPNGSLTEVLTSGFPWYPGGTPNPSADPNELPNPHGLGTDLNGNLYIGEDNAGSSNVRRLSCAGVVSPLSDFSIPNTQTFNIGSIGNIIYVQNQDLTVKAYNACTGAFINEVCFDMNGEGVSTRWGFYVDKNGNMYSAFRTGGGASSKHYLFKYTASDFGGGCISPFITSDDGNVSVGDVELPEGVSGSSYRNTTHGITVDPSGNIYLVQSNPYGGGDADARILKYNAAGQFQGASAWDSSNGNGGYYSAVGIVYSETSGLLYISTGQLDDCVAIMDPNTLTYVGVGIPAVPGSTGKGIGIRTECCPVPLITTVPVSLCGATVGTKYYLQQLIGGSCKGTICGGVWTLLPGSTDITFDNCDNSITITGTLPCADFGFVGVSTQCGSFDVTLELCAGGGAAVNLTQTAPTCTGATANNNGTITFAAATNVTNFGISSAGAATYDGPAYPATSFTGVGQNISSTISNTGGTYIVRVFNGSAGCYTDTPVTVAPVSCNSACSCEEYIYLNEPEEKTVLKFKVNGGVPLTMINSPGGGAWYPGPNVSELPFPHGIATDLNGNLYIGAGATNSYIRKLTCDGDIFPVSGTTVFDPGVHTNMFSIGNTLYVTGLGGPSAFDLCTGAKIGQMCLAGEDGTPIAGTPWGLSYNPVTETVYVSGLTRNRVWAFSRAQLEAGIAGTGTCILPLIVQGTNATVNIGENFTPNDDTGVLGIVGDNAGNIYVVESATVGGPGTYILKYNASGNLLAKSAVDNVLGGGGYHLGMGIVWSEGSNRLYLSNRTGDPTEDCIAAFDANTMAYLGAAAPNPLTGAGAGSGKAIGIVKECCPINLPAAFTKNVCGQVGQKFYLNKEAFNTCDGIVCGSSWTPILPLDGMTFDPCDNSVTFTSNSVCGNFTLNIGSTNTGCPAQNSIFSICTTLDLSTTPANVSCSGVANGSVDLTVSGGVPPYSYDWSNDGPENPDDDIADVTGLAAGTYTVTVTDAGGCSGTASVVIGTAPTLVLNVTSINENQCGHADGIIDLTVSGGTPPYTYDWSNDGAEMPDNDQDDLINLAAGTYTVTVTDALGCSSTTSITITCTIPASIGNYTWIDENWNGLQDPTESPLPGVVVILTGIDNNGNAVNQTEATDGNGFYLFDDLFPGDYKLTFVTPPNYILTNVNDADGTLDANDSDADVTMGGMTAVENLVAGENNPDYDAGYYIPASIGDYTWIDENANGVQEPNEQALEGVQVMLIGTDGQGNAVMQTEYTAVDGSYLFDNLFPGTYKLKFTPPAGSAYEMTGNDLGGDDTQDSDAIEAMGGMTATTTLISGEFDPTWDAGFYEPVSLGDYVWLDENANGIQDVNEVGLAGVTVKLQNGDGTPATVDADGVAIVDQVTNGAGWYNFTNLVPGTYKVMFINPNPAKYTLTAQNAGTDDAQDSDVDDVMLMSATTTLTSGQHDPTLDAGFFIKAKVGDFVWHDQNGNGVQDGTEPGINGATVTLTGVDNQGNVVNQTTTTFGNGMYMFGDLVPGDYKITFTTPTSANYTPTEADQGGSDATDSDAGPMGMTPVFPVTSGDTIPTFDAGYYIPAKIGDFVWNDLNWNGIQDPLEPGIAGVEVILSGVEGDGDIVNMSTTTDATGMYMFGDQTTPGSTSLVPGTYKLTFVTPTGGYLPTNANDTDGTDANDSDADPAMGGMTVTEVLESGEYNPDYDAGYYIPASIGDYVWKDLNANGIQETGEPGIVDALVTLTGIDGQGNAVTLTTLTDVNGYYLFDNLHPGTYKLTFATPAGCDVATYLDEGTDNTIDSDANPAMGNMTINEVLISGEHNPTYDAGFYSYASIGDYVWEDYSADGEQDSGEPGIPGVIVMLTGTTGNGTAVMLQTTTGPNGFYEFNTLVPGTYKLKFTTPTGFITTLQDTPSGNDIADSDVDPVMGMTTPTVLVSGEDDPTWDAGYYSTDYGDLPNSYGTLSGPSNGANHVLNPNLMLGSCVDAELNGQPEAMAGLMTGGDDNTLGVPVKGTCTTGTDDENGITFVTPLIQGSVACIEVDAINTSGSTAVLQGWIDFNGDGDVLDAGEELTLTNNGQIPNGGVTDARYCFNVPANATFQGGAAFTRFRLSPQGGLTSVGQAIGGEVEDYKVPVGKIGNLVWNDANFNGTQNVGEAGIANVPVEMTWAGPDGNIATTADNQTYNTTTNLGGLYYFCGVLAGTYKITVLSPAMMTPTRTDIGSNVTDSDGAVMGMDMTMVMEQFTIVNPMNMPVGENSTGDMGTILGYADAQTDETHDFGFAFLDYGDLPQQPEGQQYNTTMAETGAVHVTTPTLALGACVDAERDGQPDDDSGVYDALTSDLGDGDDGINTQAIDMQDCAGNVFAQVSAASYLCENKLIVRQINAQGEYVYYVVNGDFSPQINAAGGISNVIGSKVIISGNATTGAYTGNAVALTACIAQQEGVSADLVNIGGTASFTMNCFDLPTSCNDDESGIVFATPLIPTFEACIDVTAFNTTGAAAVLQGWIDWNGNQQLEAGEALVFTNGGVIPAGGVAQVPYCFTVPADAHFNAGRVYARFRLSPNGGLTVDGPDKYGAAAMPLGEVEDYIEEVGKVGNLIWEDRNFDGLQGDPVAEPGMNGVKVQLMWAGRDGNITTMADNRTYELSTGTVNGKNGLYYFCGLIDGQYKLTATTPTDFVPTLINQGNNDQLDADDFVNGDIFTWPDVANLILNEAGVSDMPGMLPNFPDAHDDQTHDMGYVALDFGDNPDTYATTLPNGAHATVVPGLFLGMGVDSEPNGQPDVESGVVAPGGDDNDPSAYNVGMVPANGDDEDGLRILTPMIPGYEACVEIKTTVTAPYSPAYVSMWIDYNGNDAFDAGEKVTFTTVDGAASNSAAVVAPTGQVTRKYCFTVPSNATFTGGEAYIRVRMNTTPNIAPTGLVIFGEVEDYWQPLGLVGNYAWMDSDIEGDQDSVEMMLPNVPIQLRWSGEDDAFGTADDRLYNTTTNAQGVYTFLGLTPDAYRITPLKYTGVANPIAGVEPLNKILTIPNLPPANDNNDSDAAPFIPVTVPDLTTNFFPTLEDGLKDNNGLNGFPDNRENLSLDMGFITNPIIVSSLAIKGVAKATSGTCGNFDVIMDLCIKNPGEVPLNMLQAGLDLTSANAFGSLFVGFVPGGAPQILAGSTAHENPTLNSGYNGGSNINLFNGTSGLLWPGEQVCVRMRFELNTAAPGSPSNPDVQAVVSAKAVNFQGVAIPDFINGGQVMPTDLSDDGMDPMSTNPLSPGDTGGSDDPTPLTNCWQISQPLAQNDIVHVSMDATCFVWITADMVVEGEADECTEQVYPLGGYYAVKVKNMTTGLPIPNPVPASYIGQTLLVEIEHVVSCNKTWGKILIEDKLAPTLTCPANVTIACSESTAVAHTGNVTIQDCSTTTTQLDEQITDNGECGTPRQIITRTFIVTDAWGNQSTCSQTITVTAFDLANVVFPANITVDCESAYLNPNATAPVTTGRPSINGFPIGQGGLCSASISYTDEVYDICTGSYEVLRTWKVRNTCLGVTPTNPVIHTQIIRVKDFGGPVFACPGNVTVSVDAEGCCATAALPDMIITEGCSQITNLEARVTGVDPSTGNITTFTVAGTLADFPGNNYWNADTLAVFPYTQCLPMGAVYTVKYTAKDGCENTSTCQFTMTIEDLVPPVTACDEWTQVGLGFDGTAFVNASDLDDGSYDNCAPVHFKARRMDANACQTDTVFHDQVKFCCSDINDTINVILRVYDVDPGTGVVSIGAFEGHYNDCMVQVLVEDKIKPICTAPANVTVTCELFDPSLWAYGTATGTDNCCVDTITGTVNYSQFDSLCNRGTITRNWTVKDCAANTANCSQKVIVQYNQEYYVKFPNDRVISVCDGTGAYGAPTFFGEDCELLATSFVDEIFTVVPDACFKIERTWTVINWCTYTPNAPCIYVPNPDMINGPTVSAPGNNIANWAPTSTAVNGATLNYGTIWSANANCYQYKQIIKIVDTADPVVVTPSVAEYCDYSTNDANYWNADYWWDNTIQSHNLCEGEADIAITGIDSCSGANISFRYLLFLDLDGNGSMETVVPGSPLPQVYNEVRFDNANTALYAGGTPRAFDHRAVAPTQKWGWGLTTDTIGGARIAHVRWVNQQGQNAVPQLPLGTHKIKWTIEDGCGNEVSSETTFTVKDCKKPTVVCVNGLSINQMNGPANTVTLWASDFLAYGEDNCTPSPLLKYGIRKSGTGSGFPTVNGAAQTSVTFDCSELGTQLVELWAEDKAGNADFCETYVLVQDNTGACGNNSMATIAGALATEATDGVEDATVQLDGSSNGIPVLGEVFSSVTGDYAFSNAIPLAANTTVTPTMDIDPLNGVNTWDLVLISRHILGLEPLNTPYKLIAADANKSGTVTTFDIVELRKLILGTYNALPNNESWRFIDKTQVFTNPANPFADVIRENLQIANIQASITDGDFIGAKIGDVDGTATPNNLVSSDDRTNGQLLFDVTDRKVKAGETFTVNFKAAEKVAGYQFTMNFNGLEVVDVTPGAGMNMDNFGIFTSATLGTSADAITTSADATEGEFGITFRAKQAGNLSNMLGVSSRITKAVAFTSTTLGASDGNQLDVAFRFNNGGTSTIAGLGFEVYQNAPNPWINKTVIGFHLPEATTATLTVTDATGRTIYTQKGNFAKGYNSFSLDRKLVDQATALYYKVETATNSGVKQMIQVR